MMSGNQPLVRWSWIGWYTLGEVGHNTSSAWGLRPLKSDLRPAAQLRGCMSVYTIIGSAGL